jgi:3',5'-cyclic-AMP phosphodiesterase
MISRYSSFLLQQVALILLLLPCFSPACFGETLYEHSARQLSVTSQTANPDDYAFVVVGDSRDGDAVFTKVLRLAKSYNPLFILHGGDFSARGGEGETARFLSMLKENVPEIPVFVVLGNHENRSGFARTIGPFDFTLESKRLGLTLVAVDNSDDVLKAEELEYLRSRLFAGGASRFVAMHVPPRTDRWYWHTFTDGADQLKNILAKGQVQGAFFSHVHLYDRSEFGGVPAIITGGAGAPLYTGVFGNPVYHILVVRVKNGKASFTMVQLSQ